VTKKTGTNKTVINKGAEFIAMIKLQEKVAINDALLLKAAWRDAITN